MGANVAQEAKTEITSALIDRAARYLFEHGHLKGAYHAAEEPCGFTRYVAEQVLIAALQARCD
jgi:hypothetical protein